MTSNAIQKIPQWLVNLAIVMLLGAYGFICNSVVDRIDKVESRVDNLNPVLLQIQKDLSSIQADIEWIKRN